MEYLSLAQASREIAAQGVPCTYHQLWRRASYGKIPVLFMAGRMVIAREDLPKIAEHFQPNLTK